MSPVTLIGQPFVQLSVVDSSNNYAMRQVQAQMAGHGATWFAHHQFAGKGQRGKQWQTEPGQNILLSVALETVTFSITEQWNVSMAIALACQQFIASLTQGDVFIKWPNDIYWKDRKAGGILIENIIQGGQWKFAIVGIGINVNQVHFNNMLTNPVSLKQITGKTFDPIELSHGLCQHIQLQWDALHHQPLHNLLQAYNDFLYQKDKRVPLRYKNTSIMATIIGVNQQGQLIIDDGNLLTINFGEIVWQPAHRI